MYYHISMFRFRDRAQTALHREEIRRRLETFPAHIPSIRSCKLMENVLPQPPVPDGAPLLFCDLVQILGFETQEELAAYPHNEYHQQLVRETDDLVERVCIIDFAQP